MGNVVHKLGRLESYTTLAGKSEMTTVFCRADADEKLKADTELEYE
jgi:hypothetical protein